MAEVVLMVGGVDIQSFELLEGRAMIGRSSRAHICLSDDTVSAKHAVIEVVRDHHEASNCQFFLQDLCSTNGTRLSSRDIRRALLRDGDVIEIGWQQLRFTSSEVCGVAQAVQLPLQPKKSSINLLNTAGFSACGQ